MSDTPLPDPLDEQASDLLDAGDDAPADQADLGARLDDFRGLRARLADVPEPDPEVRERSITAALAAFDDLLAETDDTADEDVEPEVEPEPEVDPVVAPAAAPVTELTRHTARRPSRSRRWFPVVGSAAAVVVVLLGIAALAGGGSDEKLSSSAPRSDKAENSSAVAADGVATASTAAGAATTAAASAGGRLTPNPPAAGDVGGGATTTAAAGGPTTFATAAASAGGAEPTSTIDARDVTTTIGAAESTTAPPPSTTTTTVDPTLLPYLGEFSTTEALDAVLRQPRPAVDPTDDGRAIRTQLAEGSCDIVPFGEPIGVLRWNGRDAVAVRSASGPFVQVIPLDGCNPVALLDTPA